MRLFVLSLSDYHSDGRLKTIIRTAAKLYKVDVFSPKIDHNFNENENITFVGIVRENSLVNRLKEFIAILRRLSATKLILVSNRKAACLSFLLFLFLRRKTIVYDMREFYEFNARSSVKQNIGTIIETCFINNFADFIICANEERRRLLKLKIKKNIELLVFENIRKLDSFQKSNDIVDDIGQDRLRRLKELSSSNVMNIVSTDGISYHRETQQILNTCLKFGSEVHLHIFGDVSNDSLDLLSKVKEINNVTFYGKVSAYTLRQVLSYMDVGLVKYHTNDRNNRYCASGKLYEFVYSGIPVLCSTNPPLKKFVSKTGTGIADSCLDRGVSSLLRELNILKKNVKDFNSTYKFEDFQNDKVQLMARLWKP